MNSKNTVQIGVAPQYRGEFSIDTKYYQDNLMTYYGCIFRCSPLTSVGAEPVRVVDEEGHLGFANEEVWDVVVDMLQYYNFTIDSMNLTKKTYEYIRKVEAAYLEQQEQINAIKEDDLAQWGEIESLKSGMDAVNETLEEFRREHERFEEEFGRLKEEHVQFNKEHDEFRALHEQFESEHAEFERKHDEFMKMHEQFEEVHELIFATHDEFRSVHEAYDEIHRAMEQDAKEKDALIEALQENCRSLQEQLDRQNELISNLATQMDAMIDNQTENCNGMWNNELYWNNDLAWPNQLASRIEAAAEVRFETETETLIIETEKNMIEIAGAVA